MGHDTYVTSTVPLFTSENKIEKKEKDTETIPGQMGIGIG